VIERPGRFRETSRLTRPADYRGVFQSGRRSADSLFVILSRANGLDHARLGLAISRRHIVSAVKRNRVKRVIRETFRLHQSALKGLDIVVMAQTQTGSADKHRLAESLARHWRKLAPCDARS
jgi:ribonuclease P protein component